MACMRVWTGYLKSCQSADVLKTRGLSGVIRCLSVHVVAVQCTDIVLIPYTVGLCTHSVVCLKVISGIE